MLAAFILGLGGSLHCLGMCGPIALALPGAERGGMGYFLGRLLYNLGRILSYSFLGGIVAMLGVAAAMFDAQRWFSLILGILLILMALREYGVFGSKAKMSIPLLTKVWQKGMAAVMRVKGAGGLFAVGVMNGLLPCGLVYAGLFLAANSDSAWLGMAKMALFGLGTLPLMLSLSWSGKWLKGWIRSKSKVLMPAVMAVMGMLFVLRGMALGLPYLSPKLEQGSAPGKMKMSCCEKIEGGKANSQPKSSIQYTEPQKPNEEKP